MALTDNLVYRLKASGGETTPIDLIGGSALNTGTGSATLINDGTYGYLWRVTGTLRGAISGAHRMGEPGTTTIAFRYRVNRPAGSQEKFIAFGNSGDEKFGGGDSFGATNNRSYGYDYGGWKGEQYKTASNNSIETVVIKLVAVTSGNDTVAIWYNNPGRSGNTPEITHQSDIFIYDQFLSSILVNCAAGNVDLIDAAAWTRGLTDAEAAAVANDIRGQLEGGSGTTIPGSLGSAVASGLAAALLTATVISSSLGSATASGRQATVTTNSPTTISCALGTAAASGITAGVSVAGSATITSAAFRNNTGTLLSNTIITKLAALRLSDMTLAVSWSNQMTNGAGVLALTSGSLTSATDYLLVASNADGSAVGAGKYTAS